MISYIKWDIKFIDSNSLIILTPSWIWYEIIINELIYSKISERKEVELYLYHNITENGQNLFWFLDFEDRELFKELIKISWVWGRVAQNILSLWIERLKDAIISDDKKTIESIKWVWKKMAEKIILELKDKDFVRNHIIREKVSQKTNQIDESIQKQVIETLVMMWYNEKRVRDILQNIGDKYKSIDEIIPFVIKNI